MNMKIVQVLLGVVIGLCAYLIYSQSLSVMNALTIIFLGSLLVYAVRSKKAAWGSIKLLQHPYILALVAIGLGFMYISYSGRTFWPSSLFSTGTALLGFALGIIVYSWWNLR